MLANSEFVGFATPKYFPLYSVMVPRYGIDPEGTL